LIKDSKKSLDMESLPLTIRKYLPIFLPNEIKRIAFFQSTSKSVRRVPSNNIEKALRRNSHNYNIEKNDNRNINTILQEDINTFNMHLKDYDNDEYFIDTFSTAIRFNAYDKDDNIIVEKSYVKGGLVFDIREEEFEDTILITYPQYRKKRKDIKNDYLNLSLLKIRPISTSTNTI